METGRVFTCTNYPAEDVTLTNQQDNSKARIAVIGNSFMEIEILSDEGMPMAMDLVRINSVTSNGYEYTIETQFEEQL